MAEGPIRDEKGAEGRPPRRRELTVNQNSQKTDGRTVSRTGISIHTNIVRTEESHRQTSMSARREIFYNTGLAKKGGE